MNQFAKLFERPKYGQVVMMLQTNDDEKPELRCYVKPDELGVCQVAIGFDDWDKAEIAFVATDEVLADKMAAAVFEVAGAAT